MYSAWIKIDDSLPWIELEGGFQTKAAAQKAMKERRSKVKIKIVKIETRKNRQSY
jgi:hypothetical protein